jgi:quinol monooxygenase YgiN
MALIYEVNLSVERAIADDFRAWLIDHVQDMLEQPGFSDARILEVLDVEDAGRVVFRTQYTLPDRAALDIYLREHAAGMRAAGVARFGDRFNATRHVLRDLDD